MPHGSSGPILSKGPVVTESLHGRARASVASRRSSRPTIEDALHASSVAQHEARPADGAPSPSHPQSSLAPSRARLSSCSTSSRSRGRPANRFISTRSPRDTTRTAVRSNIASKERAYASSKSSGGSANRSTENPGRAGSHIEKTIIPLVSTHSRRQRASANSSARTGSRGRSPSPASVSMARWTLGSERSRMRSRSAVVRK